MKDKKRALGRGLDALLGEAPNKKESILEVPLEELVPGQYQPRKKMHKNTLQELAKSIREQGVLQPILARKLASGSYEIVVGERRWRAASLAGIKSIPVLVKNINNDDAAKISLIENIQREDLNAMDQARGLLRLKMEFNLSQEELGSAVGKSRPTIANLLRLTTLSKDVQEMLETGKIEMGHARALLSLDPKDQSAVAKLIYENKLSVRQAENIVSKEKKNTKQGGPPREKDADISRLEKEISEALGAKTEIKHNKNGKGKITITYKSLNEAQGVLDKIKKH